MDFSNLSEKQFKQKIEETKEIKKTLNKKYTNSVRSGNLPEAERIDIRIRKVRRMLRLLGDAYNDRFGDNNPNSSDKGSKGNKNSK